MLLPQQDVGDALRMQGLVARVKKIDLQYTVSGIQSERPACMPAQGAGLLHSCHYHGLQAAARVVLLGGDAPTCPMCMPLPGAAEKRRSAGVAPQQPDAHAAPGQPEQEPATLGGLHVACGHGHT